MRGFLRLFYETIKTIIINDYSVEPLRMINIASFNKALKSIWIKKYICKTNIMEQGKPVCDLEVQKCGGKVWLTGNLDKKDTVNLTTEDFFGKETLAA